MTLDNKHNIGDEVYLKTDEDQLLRIVTSIIVRPHGLVYELSQGKETSDHYDFEISSEINMVLKTS